MIKANMKITSKKAIENHYNKIIANLKKHNWWQESQERLIKKEEENKENCLKMLEEQGYVKIYKMGNLWRFEEVEQNSRII